MHGIKFVYAECWYCHTHLVKKFLTAIASANGFSGWKMDLKSGSTPVAQASQYWLLLEWIVPHAQFPRFGSPGHVCVGEIASGTCFMQLEERTCIGENSRTKKNFMNDVIHRDCEAPNSWILNLNRSCTKFVSSLTHHAIIGMKCLTAFLGRRDRKWNGVSTKSCGKFHENMTPQLWKNHDILCVTDAYSEVGGLISLMEVCTSAVQGSGKNCTPLLTYFDCL